jgi:cell wall-associated protease
MQKKIIHSFLFILFILPITLQSQAPPRHWHHLSLADGYPGISTYKAYENYLDGKESQTVIVAVIDSGVDINHEDLREVIWINEGEIPDNHKDDDKNGYTDDVFGWNFIGGPKGNVGPDTYESTRIYASLRYKYEEANPALIDKKQKEEYDLFVRARENMMKERNSAQSQLKQIEAIESNIMIGLRKIKEKLDAEGKTIQDLESMDFSSDYTLTIPLNIINQFMGEDPENADIGDLIGLIESGLGEDIKRLRTKVEYNFNPDYDPRKTIVMDDYSNSRERYYGNNDVVGPDASHGTHVAGIVGAVNNNQIGMDGIARNVKIMAIRTVPDGDERDKDVANAIRYAVENGASVINMSFGKGFDWDKEVVDEAVKFAEKNDVLLVHAAGNSSLDLDANDNFPNRNYYKKGKKIKSKKTAKNWIEVGAVAPKLDESLTASFSNYGKTQVDVFAPGVQIFSTTPNNTYASYPGTSMASPMVAGAAAVLMSYYPGLTAVQVKDIIMKSATVMDMMVNIPGTGEIRQTNFKNLSISGGILNLEEAVKMAQNVKGKKKIKKSKSKA